MSLVVFKSSANNAYSKKEFFSKIVTTRKIPYIYILSHPHLTEIFTYTIYAYSLFTITVRVLCNIAYEFK